MALPDIPSSDRNQATTIAKIDRLPRPDSSAESWIEWGWRVFCLALDRRVDAAVQRRFAEVYAPIAGRGDLGRFRAAFRRILQAQGEACRVAADLRLEERVSVRSFDTAVAFGAVASDTKLCRQTILPQLASNPYGRADEFVLACLEEKAC